ncbi:unnamed protein product [Prunus armeniaca]
MSSYGMSRTTGLVYPYIQSFVNVSSCGQPTFVFYLQFDKISKRLDLKPDMAKACQTLKV